MGSASWAYNELSELIAVTVEELSGVFALVNICMSYGHYWITQALDNVQPELDYDNDDAGKFQDA
jgi:hypothetical protein